jgi:hypothetical protein
MQQSSIELEEGSLHDTQCRTYIVSLINCVWKVSRGIVSLVKAGSGCDRRSINSWIHACLFGKLSVVSKHGRPSIIVSVVERRKTTPVAHMIAYDWFAYPDAQSVFGPELSHRQRKCHESHRSCSLERYRSFAGRHSILASELFRGAAII